MARIVLGWILAGSFVALIPGAARGQQRPPPQRPDTANLVFEREVFFYPQYERRNPFVPLLDGAEGGPRFEEIRLLAVIYSSNPDLSVALFGPRAGQGEAEQQTARRTYRARRGERLGNVRILEIQQTRVVVEVEEFGLTEQHIMELQRPGQGGSL
ncbi:MAG: hypothetical protein ACWGSQ_17895 [Longimicrobiales bacterium]